MPGSKGTGESYKNHGGGGSPYAREAPLAMAVGGESGL